MAGYVYIGTDQTKKYFKIGKTKDIKRRQKEIQHMNPTFKVVFWLKPLETPESETEKYLHELYAEKRVYGEWFNISIDDIYEILHGSQSREEIQSHIDARLAGLR